MEQPRSKTGAGARAALWALLLLLAVYRCFLLDRGALSFPDEGRYSESLGAVQKLAAGNVKGCFWSLTSTEGRPADALWRMLPAAAQLGWRAVGGPLPHTRESLRLVTLTQVAATLGIALVFFAIALRVFGDPWPALLGTAFYSLLANTNLYVRHILPYDPALLLGLCGVLLALVAKQRGDVGGRTCLGAGLVAGLTFATYPGYYPLGLVILALLIWRVGEKPELGSALRRTAWFAVGGFGVIGGFEVMARLGGTSYLGPLRQLSGTITQGSFEEGLTFPLKYLWEVEGWAGLCLGAAILAAVGRRRRPPASRVRADVMVPAFWALGAAFALYSLNSWLFQGAVWYGRLLHLYVPFAVLAGMIGISRFPEARVRIMAASTALAAAAVSFVSFNAGYLTQAYPRDVLLQHGIIHPERYAVAWESPGRHAEHLEQRAPAERITDLLLVNPAHLHPIPAEFRRYEPPEGATILFRGRSYLSCAAYGFEGYSIAERARLRERDYQVGVYRLPDGKS